MKFDNSKLIEGWFNNSYGHDVEDAWRSEAESRVLAEASGYKKIFSEMRLNFMEKYGNPQSEDGEEIIWRNGGNQIKLTYKYEDGPSTVISGLWNYFASLTITYKAVSTNTNY